MMIEVSYEKSALYAYIVLLPLLLLCYCCCFSFCHVDTVCGFTTEYLDLIDYNYTVRGCTTYEYVFVYKNSLRMGVRSD